MNANAQPLTPAVELARADPVTIPNESAEYRAARTALLAEKIDLRRHIERVAAQRRALPSGSVARNRSGGVDHFDQSSADVDLGAGFFQVEFDCAPRRLERRVEFVAGIAIGDFYDDRRGKFDRALVGMTRHF
jgi:hypothetical protein